MRESKRLKAITLLLQWTRKNSHKLVLCAERAEEKAQNIKKKKPTHLFPEKIIIFLPRVGGVGCSEGTVSEDPARHRRCPPASATPQRGDPALQGPSVKQGVSAPLPAGSPPAVCVPV